MLRTKSERGQVLVILAIGLVALLGFTAVAVDVGNAYGRRRAAQNACDAGAIAGARALADNESNEAITTQAEDYAARNYPGLASEHLTVTIDRNERTVAVEATTDTGTFFARAIGVDTLPVHGRAKAQWFYGAVETTEGIGSVIPMIVRELDDDKQFEYGTVYNFKEGDGPGMFGWLRFNGCDSSCDSSPALEQALTEPLATRQWSQPCGNCKNEVEYCSPDYCGGDYGPVLPEIGEWISGGTGKVNSNGIREALKNIILGYDSTDADETPWPIQNPVVIPIYSERTGGGNNARYLVAGFVKFKMCCYNQGGNSSYHPCDEGHCDEAQPQGEDYPSCDECIGKCTGLENKQVCVCGVSMGQYDEVPGSGSGTERTYRENVVKLIE